MVRIGRPLKYGPISSSEIVHHKQDAMKELILSGPYINEKIHVSVFLAGRREHLWEDLYNSLVKNNDINFEFVISGPVYPKFELPKNFKFLYSCTKPEQS